MDQDDLSENTEAGCMTVCPRHPGHYENHATGLECSACAADDGDGAWFDPAREAEDDELGAMGDARRCPRHPHVKTSSDDGMFDGPCPECECEAEDAARAWEVNPANAFRTLCAAEAGPWNAVPWTGASTCLDKAVVADDDIPF